MKKILIIAGLLLSWATVQAQGIGSAQDLMNFINAWNNGEDILQ